jgi:hypothetical protein
MEKMGVSKMNWMGSWKREDSYFLRAQVEEVISVEVTVLFLEQTFIHLFREWIKSFYDMLS